MLLRHRWSGIIGEGIAFFSIYIIGWLFNHAWIGEWLRYGTNKVEENACCTPTLWGFASMTCGFNLKCGFVLGIFLTILLSVFILFLLFRVQDNDSSFVIGLSIPAALLISPYLWTYSQIILILPILLITNIMRQKKIAYLIVATFPLVIGLISSSIVYISIGIGVDTISSIVPLIVLIFFFLAYRQTHFAVHSRLLVDIIIIQQESDNSQRTEYLGIKFTTPPIMEFKL